MTDGQAVLPPEAIATVIAGLRANPRWAAVLATLEAEARAEGAAAAKAEFGRTKDAMLDEVADIMKRAATAEREACARLAEQCGATTIGRISGKQVPFADLIRARRTQ